MRDPKVASGTFFGNINIVLVTYTLDGVLALVTGILVARGLGPDGRGAYALFLLSAAFAAIVLGLGIGNAAIYYINKREIALRDVVSAMQAAVVWTLVLSAIFVAATAGWAGETIFGIGIPPWYFIFAVPIVLELGLMRLVLQAEERFIDLGIATIGQQTILLAAAVALSALEAMTPARVVGAWLGANALMAAYAMGRVGLGNIDPAHILRPHWPTIRRLARFGLQGEAGNILQLLNYRLDQFVVRGFVGLAGVGIYAVAAALTEAVFLLANAVALVLLPRLSAADADESARIAPIASRNTMLIAGIGAIGLAAIAQPLVPRIFGEEFDTSVAALWWLLPGAVALTGSKVLTSYIFSQGRPLVNTAITVVSLVTGVVSLFILVPRFDVNGAAAASSIAYGTHFAAALVAYTRISGRRAVDALVPRPSDVQLYVDALRGLFARTNGAPPLDAERPQRAG